MDWTDCPEVERILGKLSGAPVIFRSRLRPNDLLANRDEGQEWLAENFAPPIETVRTVLSFCDRNKGRIVPPYRS